MTKPNTTKPATNIAELRKQLFELETHLDEAMNNKLREFIDKHASEKDRQVLLDALEELNGKKH